MPAPTEANAGPPPAYGTDTSHDKNLQDLHEVFKFSAKLQFAEAICKIDPIPLNRVQLLLDACPIPSEETLKFEKAEYFHAVSLLLSFRSQESLLALAHFYVCSKGQFETEIIPRLIAYLDVLKLLKFSDYNTLLNAERFSYHLAVQLASICWNVPRGRAALLEPFLSFYQYILQHNNLPLIYGTLTAMGEVNFPFSKDQAKVVSAGLDSVISNIVRPVEYKDINGDPKPMLLMIFKVMEQLTRSSIGIPPDLSEQLYSYGHYFVAETTPPPSETLFIQIVIVMVRVCICEPPLAERVFLCLLDWLSAATSPMRLCASPLLYQATLRGIAEIAACYPTKLHKIIEPLRDFVLYGAPTACDTGLHDEAVSALCSVLRLEMTTHGVEVPRQIINSLFNILHPSMHYTPTSPPLSTNSASATPGSPSPEEQLHRIIISLLGRITCALDDPKVTEICMPNFISRISYPPTDLDLLMLEQLTNIALLGQQNSTNEVVNLMINLFKKIVKDPNHGVIVNTIPAALHNLALGLTNVKLRQDLCLRTLKLFQQLAKSVKLAPDYSHSFGPNLSSPVLKGMGFLLPTMAELAQLHLDSAHILNPDPITLKLFRNVWFYCVLFRYTTVGTWRSDWRDAAARLALQMPVIITSKAHIYLEMELELDNILKQGFDKDEFNQTQKRLLQLLPAVAYQLRSLTFPQSAYILCVYTLETLRVRSPFPSFKAIFSYLEDQGIDNPSVVACLRAIADTVFSEFLNLMGSTVSNPAREAELAEHTQFLLVHFCHPVEAVRKAADQYILSMAERFPQVLWSKPCVVTLMELLECVGTGAVSRPLDMLSAVLPSSGYQINLPDDTPSRHRLLQVLRQLCCVWLRTGISHAPSETHAVLHDYIRDVVQPSTRTVLLIVEIASAPPDTSDASIPSVEAKSGKQAVAAAAAAAAAAANAISVPEDCSLFVHSLELKAKYSGEVKGMLKLLADVAADGQADAARMERFLLRDFTAFQLQNQNVSSGAVHEIQQVLFRAAAYLVESGQPGSAELLHNICWIPVKTFTEESLVVGVAVWEWLLAERPDLGNRVMNGIGEAWAWSVDTRIGLFSRASRPPNPLSIVQKHDSPVDTGEVHGHLPHRIWLKFIESRFAVVRHNNPTQLDILTTMLHKAVADPHALSIQPSSLGARFQLLLLCQKFIQAGVCDLVSEVLLRERLYASTATWFYYEAMWYHYDSSKDDFDENVIIDGKKELQADVKLLIDFCKSLAAERIFEPESSKTPNAITPETRGRVPTEPTPIHQAISISTSTSFSHMRNTPLASSVSLDPPMPGSISGSNSASFSHTPSSGTISAGSYSIGTSGVLSSSTGTISRNMTVNSSIRVTPIDLIGMGLQGTTTSTSAIPSIRVDKGALGSIDEGRLRELRKRRNLLILLVGHEIERIVVWNNPLNRISLQIPEEQKFKYDNLPKNLKCTWRDYIVTAWSISSKLAIQLVNRFPQGRMQKVLQELILAEPTRALEIPDALQVLVTEDTVRANIPELKMLLYWTSVTPPKALSFLGRAYQSHPLVTQYAIRVLQSFSPETIIFYLPQLVQTLRYDKTDLIEAYLMDAALRNEFLAHQLIWNLQTYTETDPMDPNARSPNDDFTRKCLHLRDRVLAAMDPRSLRQFREEFDFFNNFTVLSGKLLKVEVAQRRGVLKEDLRAQRVDSGTLYLPTNPNNVVVGIDVESCMTLQSAAKVPILVNFKVVSRESSHYTGAAKSTSAITPNGSMTSLPLLSHSQQGTSSAPLASSVPLQSSSAPQPRRGSRQMARDPIVRVQGCIFKSGDDTRQDMLALQVIDLFKRIFQSVGLDLYLFPYKVIATKPGCGIIELVPNTMSRDQLGKKVDGSLFDYFIAKYGPKNSLPFQTARRNFIQSMAAYAIVSYILQIKDRHNGNILVDDEGHIVHIDFGFIFDISPGGDFKFENSPFKLSQEMIDIMGGKPNAEQFVWFMELGVKAFLAVRQHVDAIITLVDLMLPTQLPCFKEVTLTNLKTRFCPERNETDAAKFGAKIMAEGFSRSSTFFTYFYDLFQYIDNGIDF